MESTLDTASRFAQMAFADEKAGRHVEALAHAGIALELLAKAVLIHTHPLLVVDAPRGELNVLGMKAAIEGGDLAARGVRTIGVNEALRRCAHLVKGFEPKTYGDLVNARNGSVHVGHGDPGKVAEALAHLADAAERLLPTLGIEATDFWGSSAEPAALSLMEYAEEIRKRVAEQVDTAATNWRATVASLGEAELQALRLAAPRFAMRDEQEPWECPACHETAILEGELDVEDDVDWEYDDGEVHPVGYSFLVLKPYRLSCLFCELRLTGPAEVETAGVPASVRVERENEDDIIAERNYDPDDFDD